MGIYAEDLPQFEKQDDLDAEEGKKEGPQRFLSGLKRTVVMAHGTTASGTSLNRSAWTRQDFIRQQLRSQLGHDLWWIALAVFIITSIETGQFERDPVVFATFNVVFEVVSAYGCVGISTGVPWNTYSFSGAWHIASKLVLCAVMLRGRHRGLPVSIDRAILLPDESLSWAEEEDAHKRTPSLNFHPSARVSRETLRRPRSGSLGQPGSSIRGGTANGEHDIGQMV